MVIFLNLFWLTNQVSIILVQNVDRRTNKGFNGFKNTSCLRVLKMRFLLEFAYIFFLSRKERTPKHYHAQIDHIATQWERYLQYNSSIQSRTYNVKSGICHYLILNP